MLDTILQAHNVGKLVEQDREVTHEEVDPAIRAQVEFLYIRSLHSATGEDGAVVGDNYPQDYLDYWRRITGNELVTVHQDTEAALQQRGFSLVEPYIATPEIHHLADRYDAELTYPANSEILAQGVVIKANDKAYFRRVADQIGMPVVPGQEIIDIQKVGEDNQGQNQQLNHAMTKGLKRDRQIFIQANVSAGGFGNIDIKHLGDGRFISTKLNQGKPMTEEELFNQMNNWANLKAAEGSDSLVIAPFVKVDASHTVSMYIPEDPDEDVYIFGDIFAQKIEKESHDYMGFVWPARDRYVQEYGADMVQAARRWAEHLRELGYTGPTDVDFAIGRNPNTNQEMLFASESNTRWDGFSFAMRYAAIAFGWDFRTLSGIDPEKVGISAHDHVITSAVSTDEIVQRLKDANIKIWGMEDKEGQTSYEEGVIITMPPKVKTGELRQFGIAYFDKEGPEIADLRLNNVIDALAA